MIRSLLRFNTNFLGFQITHCVKSIQIWSFSGPYFPTFVLSKKDSIRIRENTCQKKCIRILLTRIDHSVCDDSTTSKKSLLGCRH